MLPGRSGNSPREFLINCTVHTLYFGGVKVSHSALSNTDHYIIMADLKIKPFVCPTPPTHSFRLTGFIDRSAFVHKILYSQRHPQSSPSIEDLLQQLTID